MAARAGSSRVRQGGRASNPPQQDLQAMVQKAQHISSALQQQKAQKAAAAQANMKYSFPFIGIPEITHKQIMDAFGRTRFIVLCGPKDRAHSIAVKIDKMLKLKNIRSIGQSDFYAIFSVGPILSCAHGMGGESMSIFMNELISVLTIAGVVKRVKMLRIGSAGGLHVDAGTLVISSQVLNSQTLQSEWIFYSCGAQIKQQCRFDGNMSDKLFYLAKALKIPVAIGKTVTTDCYYEGQARLDGSLCAYDDKQKMQWLQTLDKIGVRDFEMEGLVLAGMCSRNNIPCALMCIAYLDRLKMDTTPSKYSKQELASWMDRAVEVSLTYIRKFVLNSQK